MTVSRMSDHRSTLVPRPSDDDSTAVELPKKIGLYPLFSLVSSLESAYKKSLREE